ncbi:hypothetical protein H8I91_09435 [Serratia fonticola]|uniref:hypothetical protein n=1 Tax=Serratia fonticola TaxID=47917 RepID=UPI0005873EA9|nr:hypothetical protein [Serratia fonticola]MBC3250484.1 hypothetical protein [Serratia fonticola]
MSSVNDMVLANISSQLDAISAENDVLRFALTQLIRELPADKKFSVKTSIIEAVTNLNTYGNAETEKTICARQAAVDKLLSGVL